MGNFGQSRPRQTFTVPAGGRLSPFPPLSEALPSRLPPGSSPLSPMDLPAATSPTEASDEPLTRQTLASFRSLIANLSTPASLITSNLETLTRQLHLCRDPLLLHHILKLLPEHTRRYGGQSAAVYQAVRTLLLSTESAPLATEAIDALASISEFDRAFDDSFFVSLCFDSPATSRLWLLRNSERFGIRPYLLFTVLLGFAKDPYPYVRQAALDGLTILSNSRAIEDPSLIRGCYDCAVDLLCDTEACVRTAAVQTVSAWGQLLIETSPDTDKVKLSDTIFKKLSSMARDMSVEVRVAAFDVLGKLEMVSTGVLLQALSKKVLHTRKRDCRGETSMGEIEELASTFAGALIHGVEDEFNEVRKSACSSMQKLTALSSEFATEAIKLLSYMLNDDCVAVRLQALETMHQMASLGHLTLKVANMDMFLISLSDNSPLVRDAVRKVLKSVKLPNLEIFRLSVYRLIENLKSYHQDEADVFLALFEMGRHHGGFTKSLIDKVFQEIEPSSDGEFGFDSPRVAAFLVLAISAPLCRGKSNYQIPASVFSYAVTILGRISCALADEVDQDTLLAYLSHCSRFSSPADFQELPAMSKCDTLRSPDGENDMDKISPAQMSYEVSDTYTQKREPGNLPSSFTMLQQRHTDQFLNSMNVILAKIKDIWSLVKLGLLAQGMRILRACKVEMAIFASEPLQSSVSRAFTAQYMRVVKLLAWIFEHLQPTPNYFDHRVGKLYLLLEKLDRRIRDMRYQFIGWSKEEELHILELVLVSCVLRLSKFEICCSEAATRRLSAVLSRIEHLCEEASVEPSPFTIKLKKLMSNIPRHPSMFREALDHFSLEKFELSGKLKYVSAQLAVPGNNSENALCFVQGLPVVIPVEIQLSNVSRESRLWMKMMAGEELKQFLFLDRELCATSMRFSYRVPFYRTPMAPTFTLKISIGMECRGESVDVLTRHGGPRHELTFLTPWVDVYLSSAKG